MENTLANRDKQAIWHPYTAQKYSPVQIPIVKGDGVYLIDAEGNSYIDAISSWWVNLHGHGHPYIAEKIYAQAKALEQVIFAGFTHEPAVRLAEKLLHILPGKFTKIFYSDNGSTAVEVAIKMGIQYWWNLQPESFPPHGKTEDNKVENRQLEDAVMSKKQARSKILALKNAYHGDTFGAMSVSDRSIFTLAFQDKLFEVLFIDPCDAIAIENASKGIVQHPGRTTHFEEIACFIYEPLIQGAGGMKIYEAAALDQLIRSCRQHDIICIADEVMTGFGRTGKIFASEYLAERPDIICLSKGLTGGTMALGVTACTEKIYDAFVSEDRLKTFFHGHSYTANPLACTAALASMDLLELKECLENIEMIKQQHQRFISDLLNISRTTTNSSNQTSHSTNFCKIKNLRQLGTILAFEFETKGKDGYLNNIGPFITQQALLKGVLLRPLGNTIYIMPPYCITTSQLQKVYDALIELIEEL
jgi:adenosylmethionine-8-amino-7-oxononanoate aminotransferase